LWKAKQGADPKQRDSWHARETWIAINLHLVYYSVKEDRDLIYYSKDDLDRARVVRLKQGQAALPWAFQIIIPPDENGVSFQPGIFAAISQQARETWIQEFHVQQAWHQTWQQPGDSKPMTRVKTEAVREMFRGEGEDRFAEYTQKGMLQDHLEKGGWKEAAKEKREAAKQNGPECLAEGNAPKKPKAKPKARSSKGPEGSAGIRKPSKADSKPDSKPKLRKGASKFITDKKPQGKANTPKK
jgi:hypothetical protein